MREIARGESSNLSWFCPTDSFLAAYDSLQGFTLLDTPGHISPMWRGRAIYTSGRNWSPWNLFLVLNIFEQRISVCWRDADCLISLFPTSFDLSWSDLIWHGLIWFGLIWFVVIWFSLVCCDLVCYGLIWFGIVWSDFVLFDLIWFGLTASINQEHTV